jgi:hypothetical protein
VPATRRPKRPARRPRPPSSDATKSTTRGYYDVVLKGTFEVRMSKIRSGNGTSAIASASRELEDYAKHACQGDNDIAVTDSTAKRHTRKVQMTVEVDVSDVDKATELVKSLGEKVKVSDAYLEPVGRSSSY